MLTVTQLALILGTISLGADLPPEQIGSLDHPAIREASGIVASRRYPGIFWVHNDSGNAPVLYAVRRDGKLVREYLVSAPNLDWEDIAIDDNGHLFIGDIGNNDGRLPLRTIYRIDEPDPAQPYQGPLSVGASWNYRFPQGGRFDAEGLFIDQGNAVVVAKTFDDREAELFLVSLTTAAPLWKPAILRSIGRLPRFTQPVTGADLTPDGRYLAVCGDRITRVYERGLSGTWTPLDSVSFSVTGVEAIAWDGTDLILASEGRSMLRIPESRWRQSQPRGPRVLPRTRTRTGA